MSAVEFRNIHQSYKKNHAVLDGVDFSIEAGEVVGLLGKNGAGKTTLIRIALGMLGPGEGTVRILGDDPRTDPVKTKTSIGYVSEEQALPPFMKVSEAMNLHRSLFPTWDEEMAFELARNFDLQPSARIRELSKGQARQVALLCAVSHRPPLLILDEPAGGLDPASRREFLETSIRLLNEAGSTILFSSHHMADVERLAGRIVLLHDGRVRLDQPLDELREDFTVALVNSDEADVTREQLQDLEECLGVRKRSEAFHVVMRADPETSRSILQNRLKLYDIHCRTVSLEEMFIELEGGES